MQPDQNHMRLALSEAERSVPEDGRTHPLVGAVVVKDGQILASSHRGEGEFSGDHAEYILLEHKLPAHTLAGATVYTTLEPCTTRNHPNIPCAEWLIQRKIAHVVVGMLDPNQRITGQGIGRLREANIATDLFPSHLMAEAEEMNRHFIRSQRDQATVASVSFGSLEIKRLLEKHCLGATKNIRWLVHALGSEYKLPNEMAHRLGAYLKEREGMGRPVRFRPIIAVSKDMPSRTFADAMKERALIYQHYGVTEYIEPRILEKGPPLGIDILIIDDVFAMISFTTASASTQTQMALSFADRGKPINELLDWFDRVVDLQTISVPEWMLQEQSNILNRQQPTLLENDQPKG